MRYRETRFPCDTDIVAIVGEKALRVRFVNICTSGAKIECLGETPQDTLVTLQHLNTRIAARVVWSNDRQTGLCFVLPISKEQMNVLRGVGNHRPSTWANHQSAPRYREMA